MKCCVCKKTVYNAIPYAIVYSVPFGSSLGKFICKKCLFVRIANEVISGAGFVEAQKMCAKLCSDNKWKYSVFVAQALHRAARSCRISVYSAHASQIRKYNIHPRLAKALVGYLKSAFRIQETKEENTEKANLAYFACAGCRYGTNIGRPVKKWRLGNSWYLSKMILVGNELMWGPPDKTVAGFEGWYENINDLYHDMREEFRERFNDPFENVAGDVPAFFEDQEQAQPIQPKLEVDVGKVMCSVYALDPYVRWMTHGEIKDIGLPARIESKDVTGVAIHESGARVTIKGHAGHIYAYMESNGDRWDAVGEMKNFNLLCTGLLKNVKKLIISGKDVGCMCDNGHIINYHLDGYGWLTW